MERLDNSMINYKLKESINRFFNWIYEDCQDCLDISYPRRTQEFYKWSLKRQSLDNYNTKHTILVRFILIESVYRFFLNDRTLFFKQTTKSNRYTD